MVPVTLGAPFAGGFELLDGPAPGTEARRAFSGDPARRSAVKEKSPDDGRREAADAGSDCRLRRVSKTYARGGENVNVLEGLDLEVPAGSYEALMGPSGSGKTTLLNLIAGLDRPIGGSSKWQASGSRAWARAGWPSGDRPRSASCSSRTTCCRC